MDILSNSTLRQIITEYYQSSDEPKFVRNAIITAAVVDGPAVKTMKQQFQYALYGARRYNCDIYISIILYIYVQNIVNFENNIAI